MSFIGGMSIRNLYAPLADSELEVDVEVDRLCSGLQNVAFDDGQNPFYTRGEVVRQPLGKMGIKIDARFLETEEGEKLAQVVDSFRRAHRLVCGSKAAMWEKANQWFKEGTCVGQSRAFMLSRRPKSIDESSSWLESERVDAVFFQMQHNLYYHQAEGLKLHVTQLQKTVKSLTSQKGGIEKRIAFQKASREPLLTNLEKLKNKALKMVKDKLLIKSRQFCLSKICKNVGQLGWKEKQLDQRIVSAKRTIEKLRKKQASLEDFQTLLDKLQQKKLDNEGIYSFGSREIKRFDGREPIKDQEKFRNDARQALIKEFQDENASDFVLVFEFDKNEIAHHILVQPGHTQPRIYDSDVGEIHYKCQKDLLDDLEDYLFLMHTNSITIETYIS